MDPGAAAAAPVRAAIMPTMSLSLFAMSPFGFYFDSGAQRWAPHRLALEDETRWLSWSLSRSAMTAGRLEKKLSQEPATTPKRARV